MAQGYAYAKPPDVDLLSAAALRSGDPWIKFVASLERAKLGERDHLPELEIIARDEHIDPTLSGAALDLLADAGGRREHEILANMLLDGPTYLKIEATRSAAWSGVLWLIPYMATCLDDNPRQADRDAVEAAVCNLLDPRGGELEFFDRGEPYREYGERVCARVDELIAAAGSDEASVFNGEFIDMNALIWRMLAQLRGESPDGWPGFLMLRHRFEVFTGSDCSRFYRDGCFRPLSARVVIEDFLKAHPVPPFVPGHRYFFMRDLFGAP